MIVGQFAVPIRCINNTTTNLKKQQINEKKIINYTLNFLLTKINPDIAAILVYYQGPSCDSSGNNQIGVNVGAVAKEVQIGQQIFGRLARAGHIFFDDGQEAVTLLQIGFFGDDEHLDACLEVALKNALSPLHKILTSDDGSFFDIDQFPLAYLLWPLIVLINTGLTPLEQYLK